MCSSCVHATLCKMRWLATDCGGMSLRICKNVHQVDLLTDYCSWVVCRSRRSRPLAELSKADSHATLALWPIVASA